MDYIGAREAFRGYGYVHYLDCGNCVMVIYIRFIKLYTFKIRSLLTSLLYFNTKKWQARKGGGYDKTSGKTKNN